MTGEPKAPVGRRANRPAVRMSAPGLSASRDFSCSRRQPRKIGPHTPSRPIMSSLSPVLGDACHLAVDDAGQGMAVGTAAARRDAAADDRQRDLEAPGALVFVFVGVELGPRVELRDPSSCIDGPYSMGRPQSSAAGAPKAKVPGAVRAAAAWAASESAWILAAVHAALHSGGGEFGPCSPARCAQDPGFEKASTVGRTRRADPCGQAVPPNGRSTGRRERSRAPGSPFSA